MKRIKLFLIVFIALTMNGYAQFDNIFKKAPDVSKYTEDEAVSTGIKDAFPVAFWLKGLDQIKPPVQSDDYSFMLAPGYYRFKIQSYCLHAGSYAPTEGSGYLISPLLGNKVDLIRNILQRSADHPDIEQRYVQQLIWGIEAKAKFSDYPADFQAKVTPLLTTSEIADMQIAPKEIAVNLLPADVKERLEFYSNFRKKLVDPASNYQDLENIAVRQGIPPLGVGSRNVESGPWAAIGNGFYMRSMPIAYPTSDIEIFKAPYVEVNYDAKGRIVSESDGQLKVEVNYVDSPGSDMITFDNGKQYPIWRFALIKFTDLATNEQYSIENQGWIIPSKLGSKGGNLTGENVVYSKTGDPKLQDYNNRNSSDKGLMDQFKDYVKEKLGDKFNDKMYGDNKDTKSLDDENHFNNGMKAALSDDLNAKGQWIAKNTELTTNAWSTAADALAGNDPGNTNNRNSKGKADPTGYVASPANTNMQRLGNSTRAQHQ